MVDVSFPRIWTHQPRPTESTTKTARHHQLHQLPLGENPTAEPDEAEEFDPSDRCWALDELGDKATALGVVEDAIKLYADTFRKKT